MITVATIHLLASLKQQSDAINLDTPEKNETVKQVEFTAIAFDFTDEKHL